MMKSQKGTVLLFAYECYPYNRTGSAIGAQRPFQFAKNLSALGWKVVVLCCDYQQRKSLSPQALTETVSELYAQQRPLLESENYSIVPLPSLTYQGWSDYVWLHSVLEKEGGIYAGKPFPLSFIRKVTTFYKQLFKGDYSWSWTAVAKEFVKQMLRDIPVDIMVGEHSPDAGIILADDCHRIYGIPWVADFRDPALSNFRGLFKWLYRIRLKALVRSSSAVVNVNPYWTKLDQPLYHKPSVTIVNGFDHELMERVPPHTFSKFVVAYFGSFDEHRQDVHPSLAAFAHFIQEEKYKANSLLFYRGLLHERFRELCLAAGIPEENLDIEGFIPREESMAYMKGSSVLLIYTFPPYRANSIYEAKGVYPGKIFEYMGAGVPALLIPTDQGLLEELINESRAGRATNEVEEAVSFLRTQYDSWEKKEKRSTPDQPLINRYSRFEQAKQLDLLLTQVLSNKFN